MRLSRRHRSQVTREVTASLCEVLTGRSIDEFPTHKSARLSLERFWKERAMERKTKRWPDGHCKVWYGRAAASADHFSTK